MPKKKPNFGNVKSGGSTTAPLPTPKTRIPGRATTPTYQRSKVEKAVDEVGKAIRRVPSDIRAGVDVAKGAINAVKEKARRVKKG